MIEHLAQRLALAYSSPLGSAAIVLVVAAFALGLVFIVSSGRQPPAKRVAVASGTCALATSVLGVWLAIRLTHQAHIETLQLWRLQGGGAALELRLAEQRAEAGLSVLALAVLGATTFSGVLAATRLVSVGRGQRSAQSCLGAASLALVFGVLALGLVRSVDLAFYEEECSAALPCTEAVIAGTVSLADTFRMAILGTAAVCTLALVAASPARNRIPATGHGWWLAGTMFIAGVTTWIAVRGHSRDARFPLPARKFGRLQCPFVVSHVDPRAVADDCGPCGRPSGAEPIMSVLQERALIDGQPVEGRETLASMRLERSGYGARLPPPAVVMADPRLDARVVAPWLAMMRENYWQTALLAVPEHPARTFNTRTVGAITIPAQCCCIEVTLERGNAEPPTRNQMWGEVTEDAARYGRLRVGQQ